DGTTAEHVYAAGKWIATATSQSADGSASTQTVGITAYGLSLRSPRSARYGRRVIFRGALVPAEAGVRVTLRGPGGRIGAATTSATGAFAVRAVVRAAGNYVAVSTRAVSPPLRVRVALPRLALGNRT